MGERRRGFFLVRMGMALASLAGGWASGASVAATRPNILFIAADDLRTDLGCYGRTEVKTPHLDALARRGVLFERAYCQQAVCNPSRASVLTGRRPDTLKVWDLQTHFRETQPEIVTLPQHFKQQGYAAINLGKIFHNESGPRAPKFPFADPVSWSEAPRFATGAHWQDWVVPGQPDGPKKKSGAVQCLDVPDNAYFDGQIADEACRAIQAFGRSGQPFFLAVGFWKPHLPFNAPKKYWDLYDRAKLTPPVPSAEPGGAPAIAHHRGAELRNYDGIPKEGSLAPELIAELRHGYSAGISFLDAQVGRVIDELQRADLARNTIIVFWSDHGFHLGEHDLWGKTSNYELDARVPLLIAGPGITGGLRTRALVELIDLYPTLVELTGVPASVGVEGRSLVPQLRDARARGREFAVTQHPQPFHGVKSTHMGYTLRTERYRYVEWRELATGAITARELYDHEADAGETTNCIDQPAHAGARTALAAQAAGVAARGGRWSAVHP